MDTLHSVIRSIKSESGENKTARRDHLHVFREFLAQMDKAAKRKSVTPRRAAKPSRKR